MHRGRTLDWAWGDGVGLGFVEGGQKCQVAHGAQTNANRKAPLLDVSNA